MRLNMPLLEDGRLYDERHPGAVIVVDTPAWFAWLEAGSSTRFRYALFDPAVGYSTGFMTVRKEARRRGGVYWTAYRRARGGGKVRKVYLGRAVQVTQARLRETAQRMHDEHTLAIEANE